MALRNGWEMYLQDVTIPGLPGESERIKEQMKTLGAVNAMMSGSGPTVFGIFDNEEKSTAGASEACGSSGSMPDRYF